MNFSPQQRRTYLREAFDHWHVVAILTLIVWSAGLTFYVVAGRPWGNIPIIGGDTVVKKFVPAAGAEGYTTEASLAFCNDPLTHLNNASPVPGVGTNYELKRVINNIPELLQVTVPEDGSQSLGKHSYNTSAGPQTQLAIISDEVITCILGK